MGERHAEARRGVEAQRGGEGAFWTGGTGLGDFGVFLDRISGWTGFQDVQDLQDGGGSLLKLRRGCIAKRWRGMVLLGDGMVLMRRGIVGSGCGMSLRCREMLLHERGMSWMGDQMVLLEDGMIRMEFEMILWDDRMSLRWRGMILMDDGTILMCRAMTWMDDSMVLADNGTSLRG